MTPDRDVTLGEVYRKLMELQADVKLFVSTRPCEMHGSRILVIETERKTEARQSVKRGAIAGILSSAGIVIVWETLKHTWKW